MKNVLIASGVSLAVVVGGGALWYMGQAPTEAQVVSELEKAHNQYLAALDAYGVVGDVETGDLRRIGQNFETSVRYYMDLDGNGQLDAGESLTAEHVISGTRMRPRVVSSLSTESGRRVVNSVYDGDEVSLDLLPQTFASNEGRIDIGEGRIEARGSGRNWDYTVWHEGASLSGIDGVGIALGAMEGEGQYRDGAHERYPDSSGSLRVASVRVDGVDGLSMALGELSFDGVAEFTKDALGASSRVDFTGLRVHDASDSFSADSGFLDVRIDGWPSALWEAMYDVDRARPASAAMVYQGLVADLMENWRGALSMQVSAGIDGEDRSDASVRLLLKSPHQVSLLDAQAPGMAALGMTYLQRALEADVAVDTQLPGSLRYLDVGGLANLGLVSIDRQASRLKASFSVKEGGVKTPSGRYSFDELLMAILMAGA